jgi:hypothetical protein
MLKKLAVQKRNHWAQKWCFSNFFFCGTHFYHNEIFHGSQPDFFLVGSIGQLKKAGRKPFLGL